VNHSELVYLAASSALFGMGVYGVLVSAHLLRKLLSLNLLAAAVFLMLISVGRRGADAPDPVPQAMVLTGIVVAVSATGFALALLLALYRATGSADLDLNEGGADDP
jgi:multicomponent Na+:H+ antiporter subunit C